MKNRVLITGLATAILAMIAFACKDSFLEVAPTGQLANAQLTSAKGIESALTAVYSQVNGRFRRMASPTNWVWGSIRGGDANKGTDPGDFSDINPIQRFEYQSTQGVIQENWLGLYEGIARANLVLRLIADAQPDVAEATKTSFAAQARFLRAHYYFELKRNFNNTPYVDETVDYGAGIELVKNDQDLWPKIEADMKFALENLPATQAQVGRVNRWAAASYLGKIYLYQKKYAEAKAQFDAVIANGVTSNNRKYALVPNYGDIFKASNDNNSESIWAYQAAANTGSVNNANPEFDLNFPYNTGPNGPGNCCGFFQPSFELVNSFRVDANGLPLPNGTYNNTGNEVKTDMGVAASTAFTPDAGTLDPRLDWSVGRRGIPYLDWQDHPGAAWIRNQPNGGPYSPKKYTYYKSDVGSLQDNTSWTPGYTALNYTIIRFADILLMAAECEVEIGSLEKAREYVNLIRARAANPASWVKRADGSNAANYVIGLYNTPFANQAAARTAVQFERKLELSGEGHRFYDLVRWGIAAPTINAYLAYESKFLAGTLGGSTFAANKHEYLPIPQAQIDIVGSAILKQNPGY
ncbi:RagB/SusD family nutrient uptake outer membrane protein [Haliscomenobacter hydrossis]|uniref:RagB/SusD domain-containing protein n=1 Tax=Haliscomenobacter hydrossis (strain ATCC 27775 / DSM 1100 / LMG 10767 / O) TaxID=760192 RepID=F4KX27_HALH1|nr:RagB/SusD family nutrient uptake outer membrane protein [Haliscomenobacter hydrossis]AEE48255.1 RagB/SusD domain-containing protein [Haliscomenobacter hydrossis DSM 1100]